MAAPSADIIMTPLDLPSQQKKNKMDLHQQPEAFPVPSTETLDWDKTALEQKNAELQQKLKMMVLQLHAVEQAMQQQLQSVMSENASLHLKQHTQLLAAPSVETTTTITTELQEQLAAVEHEKQELQQQLRALPSSENIMRLYAALEQEQITVCSLEEELAKKDQMINHLQELMSEIQVSERERERERERDSGMQRKSAVCKRNLRECVRILSSSSGRCHSST